MIQFFLNESLSEVRQARGDTKGGHFQNVCEGVALMWWVQSATLVEIGLRDLPKSWGIAPPPAPYGSDSPEVTETAESLTRSKIYFL